MKPSKKFYVFVILISFTLAACAAAKNTKEAYEASGEVLTDFITENCTNCEHLTRKSESDNEASATEETVTVFTSKQFDIADSGGKLSIELHEFKNYIPGEFPKCDGEQVSPIPDHNKYWEVKESTRTYKAYACVEYTAP